MMQKKPLIILVYKIKIIDPKSGSLKHDGPRPSSTT